MANIRVDGIAGLEISMAELTQIPDQVQLDMVDAGAKVLEKAIRKNAESMLQGQYYKGDVARSVTRKKPEKRKDGASEVISFNGTIRDKHHKKGTSAGEIAFINEYGKRGQPARPFISKAIAQEDANIVKAEEAVLDQFYKSKNL